MMLSLCNTHASGHGMAIMKLNSNAHVQKVHRFLMQAYETIYMLQFKTFLDQRDQCASVCPLSNDDILRKVQNVLNRLDESKIPNIGCVKGSTQSITAPGLPQSIQPRAFLPTTQYRHGSEQGSAPPLVELKIFSSCFVYSIFRL